MFNAYNITPIPLHAKLGLFKVSTQLCFVIIVNEDHNCEQDKSYSQSVFIYVTQVHLISFAFRRA